MATEKTASTSLAPLTFFIPGLNGGGAQRVFVTLVNTLVNMTNHPIHLVTSREGGAFESLVDERVVRVVLGQKRVLLSILPLARYIRAVRPAAMVSTLNYCNVAFLLATMVARVPLRKVIREAIVLQDTFDSTLDKVRSLPLRFLMRLLYRRADDVIIITEDVARSLIKHHIIPAERLRRIPNPVVMDKSARSPSANLAQRRQTFILAIGRLSHQKGFDILIKAFAQLENKDIELVILGEGHLREQLKTLALELRVAGRVIFPGFVQNSEAYLQAAAVFVLSSRYEGFSNVLTEALASGTPIVATDCPGSAREILDEGRLGRLVPVSDPKAMAEAIASEMSCPSATPEARRRRARQYAPEKIAGEYLRLLNGTNN